MMQKHRQQIKFCQIGFGFVLLYHHVVNKGKKRIRYIQIINKTLRTVCGTIQYDNKKPNALEVVSV